MKMKTSAFWLALPLLLVSFGAFAQSTPIDLEIGYRWTDVDGNEDLYKTQINEDDGLLLRAFSLSSNDLGAFDHFRIDASDLGSGPAGSLRLMAGKSDLYRFTLGYRERDVYSALPFFANPLLGQGVVPGQHTYDRNRRMIDADLEFLPGRKVTPFIGYSRNTYDGPGMTTYTLGLDEFRLRQNLDETEDEIRAGVGFNLGRVYGMVTQGWRSVESTEDLTLAAGGNAGNNPGPILGQPISAGGITRRSETEVETPFTNLYVTGALTNRIRLIGNYSRFSAETEGSELEDGTGSFVSFAISRFFTGIEESVTSRANNKTWRGGLRAEIALTDIFGLDAGFRTEERELDGSALIDTLFQNTITFGGVDPRDVREILEAESAMDRQEDVLHAALTARAVGPFTFRVGFQQAKQDVTVMPDLSEIVVPGNQSGNFERSIDTIDASATFAKSGFLLGASYRVDDADDPVLRTDFLGRDRMRLRAAYRTPGSMFRFGVTAEQLNQDNDREGANFDSEQDQLTAEFEFAPVSMLRLRGSFSQLDAESTVSIIRPETLEVATSFHEEEGEAIEGGISLAFKRFTLDADVMQFENNGSIPFTLDRNRVRLYADVATHFGVIGEWANDDYDESSPFGEYSADRYGVYLRLK
jgi:hypothetical protein